MTTNSRDDKRLGGFDAEVQILKYVFLSFFYTNYFLPLYYFEGMKMTHTLATPRRTRFLILNASIASKFMVQGSLS